ncbi:MAG: Mur ligase family protein [Candidatus Beckwithbacteria bacterium]|nr:UDP-N-acetylmuramoyl-L-alanyl-D-glutamate--2,6-diaminopimelate ligase [Patescibacteria group bacterium]
MLQKIRKLIPNFIVNNLWHLPIAILANLCYGFPSRKLTIIGITGTSGKTTTSYLIYHLLLKANLKVALISTILCKIGKKEIDIGLHVTNPSPFALQKMLKKIKDKGYTHLVLETTSHGLAQHRCWGINFQYGVLTNIAHEHLDYHKTLKNYQKAKLKLIKKAKVAVINRLDPSYQLAIKAASGRVIEFDQSCKFISKNLIGSFNQKNISAAVAIAKDLNIPINTIKKAISSFPGVPGRMEVIQTKPFNIVIDFAHKPDALMAALGSLRKITKGKLISVFGCAGLRDILKRPIMGRISSKLADITILTAEDPRTESVIDINNQIESGFIKSKTNHLYRQPDRQQAINQAIALAKPKDTVALFGKSHEKSICFGTIEHPWSEHLAVKKAIKLLSKKSS